MSYRFVMAAIGLVGVVIPRTLGEEFLVRKLESVDSEEMKVPEIAPLREVLQHLNAGLIHLLKHVDNISLNAGVATGVVSDQLTMIRNYGIHRASPKLSEKILNTINNDLDYLIEFGLLIKHRSIESLTVRRPEYLHRMYNLFSRGVWFSNYDSRTTTSNLVFPARDHVTTSEDGNKYDDCISDLIGNGEGWDRILPCNLTNECGDFVYGTVNTQDYFLTHQILYNIIGVNAGCTWPMTNQVRKIVGGKMTFEQLNEVYCSTVMREMVDAELKSGLPKGALEGDLFLEQLAVCGLMGFRDFFNHRYLIAILKMQLPNGCYALLPEEVNYHLGSPPEFDENVIVDGNDYCFFHSGAVALMALTQFLRYLIEDPSLGGTYE